MGTAPGAAYEKFNKDINNILGQMNVQINKAETSMKLFSALHSSDRHPTMLSYHATLVRRLSQAIAWKWDASFTSAACGLEASPATPTASLTSLLVTPTKSSEQADTKEGKIDDAAAVQTETPHAEQVEGEKTAT